MQEEPNPYIWNPLKLSELPTEKLCHLCGQTQHLLPLNEHIVFWVHQGKETETCTAIAFKTSYIKGLAQFLQEKQEQLNKQIVDDPK